MTRDNYNLYLDLRDKIEAGQSDNFSPAEAELIEKLQYGSFVFPGQHDEIEELHFNHNMARYDKTILNLSFAPTMACNMACTYCYEGIKKGRMSPEVIEHIVNFVRERAPGTKELDIAWFGGEPLLAMEIIEKLTDSFLDLQKQFKFSYTAMIITNGYLLNRENVDRLSDLKVQAAQVTLDGPARMHNKKRPLMNGAGSFERIIENIKYAVEKMRISIRVNIDKSFSPEIMAEMLQELDRAGLRDKVGINFGHLEALTSTCSNIAESCYNIAEFSKAEVAYYNLFLQSGFMIGKLPLPSQITCISQSVNAFLIDPEGRMFKCFAKLGDPSKAMGYIGDKIEYNNENFTGLFRFDPFLDEDCRRCNILPVCLGGCPEKRTNPDFGKEECCVSWKHNLEPMLEIIAHSRQQQNADAERS